MTTVIRTQFDGEQNKYFKIEGGEINVYPDLIMGKATEAWTNFAINV